MADLFSESPNPYQAPLIAPIQADAEEEGPVVREYNLGRSILVWSIICCVSAIPSFIWAVSILGVRNIPWIVLGVALFVALYVMLDAQTFDWQFRRRKDTRAAMFTTYGIRLVVSIIFPLGMAVDLVCGLASTSIVQALFGVDVDKSNLAGPVITFWTMLQGLMMNALLACVWGLAFPICWGVCQARSRRASSD